MRHAFLVLAHREPALCLRLVRRLCALGGDVFLHVDRKAEIAPFLPAQAEFPGRVHLAEIRHDIRWGGFAMVRATLGLCHQARRGEYDRYTLLSGDSYPIKTPDAIAAWFAPPRDCLTGVLRPAHSTKVRRIEHVFVPDTRIGDLIMPRTLRWVAPDDVPDLLELPAIFAGRAEFVRRIAFRSGSQWWSLTAETLAGVLDFVERDREFVAHFRFSAVPDESFFHSVIATAGLIRQTPRGGHVLAVFSTPAHPAIIAGVDQLPALDAAQQPFARKFGTAEDPILDALDSRWS